MPERRRELCHWCQKDAVWKVAVARQYDHLAWDRSASLLIYACDFHKSNLQRQTGIIPTSW